MTSLQDTPEAPTIEEAAAVAVRVLDEVGKAIVGKQEALRLVLCAILAKGHVLLEDYPGLGKTLAARSFARALGLDFKRAQFTPDLLPSDLTGSFLYNQRTAEFEFTERLPASMPRATRSARPTSEVKIEPERPYSVTFAFATASASSSNGITDTTGPNTSSRQIGSSVDDDSATVGGTQ